MPDIGLWEFWNVARSYWQKTIRSWYVVPDVHVFCDVVSSSRTPRPLIVHTWRTVSINIVTKMTEFLVCVHKTSAYLGLRILEREDRFRVLFSWCAVTWLSFPRHFVFKYVSTHLKNTSKIVVMRARSCSALFDISLVWAAVSFVNCCYMDICLVFFVFFTYSNFSEWLLLNLVGYFIYYTCYILLVPKMKVCKCQYLNIVTWNSLYLLIFNNAVTAIAVMKVRLCEQVQAFV
jgi:hypothetical protein